MRRALQARCSGGKKNCIMVHVWLVDRACCLAVPKGVFVVPRRVPRLLPRFRLLLLRLLLPAFASSAPALAPSAASAPFAALSAAAPRLPLALPSLLPSGLAAFLRVLPLPFRRSAFRSLQRLCCPCFRSLDQLLLAFLVVLLSLVLSFSCHDCSP